MSNSLLLDFDSVTLYPLREEVDVLPFSENGIDFAFLRDPFGFAEEDVSVPLETLAFFDLISEPMPLSHILSIFSESDDAPDDEGLVEFGSMVASLFEGLDRIGLLDSPTFSEKKDAHVRSFNLSSVRQATCAGNSYSLDPAEIGREFDSALTSATSFEWNSQGSPSTLIIPHVDLRVAMPLYAECYKTLLDSDADLFVVVGTSHFGWEDLAILTSKDFETPLGTIQTNKDLVEEIHSRMDSVGFPLTRNDIAHKPEHSIEFHALWLKHILSKREKPFTILPVLVTNIDQLLGDQDAIADQGELLPALLKLNHFAKTLGDVVRESNLKTCWISSADLAHVGRKFGDDADAKDMIEAVRDADRKLLDLLITGSAVSFGGEISRLNNVYRICGAAPNFVTLTANPQSNGKLVGYDVWYEKDTQSAVSFAGIAYD